MNDTNHSDALDPPKHTFAELSVVRLRRRLETDEGTMPKGSVGTVVFVYRDNAAYEVEFSEPVHAVVTLTGADLVA